MSSLQLSLLLCVAFVLHFEVPKFFELSYDSFKRFRCFCFVLHCCALFAMLTFRLAAKNTKTTRKNDTHKTNKEFEQQKKGTKTCVPIVYAYVLFFSIPSVNAAYGCIFESIVCKASINYGTASRLDVCVCAIKLCTQIFC